MPRDIRIDCFLEAIGQYLDAREAGDGEGMSRAAAEAEAWLAEDWPAERIRETIEPTVEEWLRDYGLDRDKSHSQLVNRLAAAIHAMLNPPPRP